MTPKGSFPVPSQKAQVIIFVSTASPFSHILDPRLYRRSLCYQRQPAVMCIRLSLTMFLDGKIQHVALLYLVVVYQSTNYLGYLDAG